MRTKLISIPIHQDGIIADTGMNISTQCLTCKHLGRPLTCKAFPEGIPHKILSGAFDHRKIFPGQTNNVIFEIRK